jgi:hypothetical protein
MAKAKLHEILAVESDVHNTYKKIAEEAHVTFAKKPTHFIETVTSLSMHEDKDKIEDKTDVSAMVETVPDKMDYVVKHAIRWFDVVSQKEATNQLAKADLVIDDKVLIADVPATCLLGLESKLAEFRNLVMAIPTLQPGKEWERDPAKGPHVYRSKHPDVKTRTKKKMEFQKIADATDHHPAQVKDWITDVPVGRITEQVWSSMLSPSEKSELLGRVDRMIRAVKRARQRANNTEVVQTKIGKPIFDFILGK